MNSIIFALGVAITGSSLGSGPPTANIPGETSKEQAATAIMHYYPARARAGGVEGKAWLKCRVTEHARLEDCVLAQENPAGFGFGDAALALAKLTKDNPQVSQTASPPGVGVQFQFKLSPPSIEPNTLLPLPTSVIFTNPDFLEKPDPGKLTYPTAALRAHVKGRVVLSCVVSETGKVEACVVTEESPTGFGFGQAAIDFASTFKMRPKLRNGVPTGGARITFPFIFTRPR